MRVIEQDEWREIGEIVAVLETLVDLRASGNPVQWRLHSIKRRVERIADEITVRAIESRTKRRRTA